MALALGHSWNLDSQSFIDIAQTTCHRNNKFMVKAQYTANSDLPKGCPPDLGYWEIGPPPVAAPAGENAKIKVSRAALRALCQNSQHLESAMQQHSFFSAAFSLFFSKWIDYLKRQATSVSLAAMLLRIVIG